MPRMSDSRSSVSRPRRAVCGVAFHLKKVDRPGEPSKTICSSADRVQSRAILKNARKPAADMSAIDGWGVGMGRVTRCARDIDQSRYELDSHISPFMDYIKF